MGHHSEAFVGIDTSKLKNAIAIAQGGRGCEVRYLGEIDTTDAATRKLVAKLAAKYDKLTFCYEAGPTGYGLHRLIESLGHDCPVVAPSLIPKKAGDRVKTNRRDAEGLARLLRAGELTMVWVPDERHESIRDLSRAREAAVDDLKSKRQQVSSLLLRLGLHYRGKTTWGKAHRSWLASQKLRNREQRIVFEELLGAERQAQDRIDRLASAIRDAVPEWSLAKVITARYTSIAGISPMIEAIFNQDSENIAAYSMALSIPVSWLSHANAWPLVCKIVPNSTQFQSSHGATVIVTPKPTMAIWRMRSMTRSLRTTANNPIAVVTKKTLSVLAKKVAPKAAPSTSQ